MKLLVNKATGHILDASNVGAWQVPSFAEVQDWPGDAEIYVWPGGSVSKSMVFHGAIDVNPATIPPPPGHVTKVVTAERLAEVLKTKGILTDQDVTSAKV